MEFVKQITEGVIKQVEVDFHLSGRGRSEHFKGRVVGFSDRLNTILVPQSFMEWSNEHFAVGEDRGVSRVILEVENPGAPEVVAYLEEHGLVAEGKPSESNKVQSLLNICVAVIVIIGAIFCALSMMILALSINLLLQKNVDKLNNLVLVGYTPATVAKPYIRLTLCISGAILVCGVALTAMVRGIYGGMLSEMFDFTLGGSLWVAVIVGVVLSMAVVLLNARLIKGKIRNISARR
jgi:hypothetical protein